MRLLWAVLILIREARASLKLRSGGVTARAPVQLRGGDASFSPTTIPVMSKAKLATTVALGSTAVAFLRSKGQPAGTGGERMAEGLLYSFVALCGNTAASLLRKQVSRASTVRPAEQVGVATALQGICAVAYCYSQGLLGTTGPATTAAFLAPAVASSVLNALTKTLETKAYAITDVSLCAPFLAFDPVMQFLLPALFAPATCSMLAWGCADARTSFPAYHPLAVACVATGAYLLASVAAEAALRDAKKDKPVSKAVAGLPVGAWMILGNCCVYAVTSRLDKAAVRAAGKTLYYAYGRILMSTTCFLGARPSRASVAELAKPKTGGLVLATCAAEAVYMLALYQAFACISPVYVTAIKRGGGVLLASFASMFFFGEPLAGRGFPIFAIVAGVVALCL
mmetsp:Transcript_24487/g.73485  ORF Transcript_24487/g.73485 Transcript_24487/m.73485 type:complete len:397 (+) Transcript_24487:223-1413(+)